MTFRKKDLQVPGTYILLLHAALERDVTIGAAGILSLRQGYYAYVGSAFGPGGLYARLRHHCYSAAGPRWHVDYLRKHATISEIIFSRSRDRLECSWADILAGLTHSSSPLTGFGASDCLCDSHLFYFPKRPVLAGRRQFGAARLKQDQFSVLNEAACF